MVLLVFNIVIIACICGSSVQSTGGDEPYFISTIAGTGTGLLYVNVPALEAKFGVIGGMAQSKNGDLYVSSRTSNVILKLEFDRIDGTWYNAIMIAGTGILGKGNDGVEGTLSAIDYPMGICLIENANGDVTGILITEVGNNRIRKLDMSTFIITTIAGTSVAGFSGDDGLAKDAQLWFPRHVYYDKSNGDIYITDSNNNRIRRVRDGIITTVVGKTCSFGDALGDGGQAVDACLNYPSQFTINAAGEWLIADRDHYRIRKVDSTGIITTVAGGGTKTGDALATSVRLTSPYSIDLTPSGELLVADYSGSSSAFIRKMDNSGFMKVIAGGGSGSLSSDNPIPAKTASIKPVVVTYARDGSDAIFIGDNDGFIFKLLMFECFGVKGSKACSGHGTCIGADECQCDSGWMGMDCSITHCFGFTSNLPGVCSGKGKCVKPDECHCNMGHKGHYCQRT